MNGQLQYNRGLTEPRLPRSALAVRVTAVMLLCFLGWAWYFQLDEVTTGSGTVEPSGREQVVQSLEGGILYHLDVKVGDIVEQGQPLAQQPHQNGIRRPGSDVAAVRGAGNLGAAAGGSEQ